MKASLRPSRYVLLVAVAGVAALAGSLLLPAAASAQPAGAPVTPTVTLVLSPATVDYGHQSIAASGRVTTSAGPVADVTVTVSYVDVDQQFAQISLTTGTNGSYSGTIPDPETAAQEVTASVAATSSTTAASESAELGFTTDAVTITASFVPPYVNAFSTGTLSGVANYVFEGSPHPLANSTLSITSPGNDDLPAISATVETSADGSFSYVTPQTGAPSDGPESAEFTVSSAATPYLEAGQLTVYMPINQVAEINNFSGTISAARVLRFSACAGTVAELSDGPLIGPLEYQYSRTPQGPWKKLGTGKSEANGPCGEDGAGGTYLGKFTAPHASAYYRAYAPAVPGQMSAVSNVIRLQRYLTEITGFAISPRRVKPEGKVSVSGRLLELTGKWLPDKGAAITIEYRYKDKTYTLKHRLTTNSAGRFKGTFRVPRTAAWLAVYSGDHDHFATASTSVRITVR
jgi:hypothetical protein